MMNRDWLERQAAKAAVAAATEKAAAEQRAAQEAAEAAGVAYKRSRGRPLGSKSKTRAESALPPAETPQEVGCWEGGGMWGFGGGGDWMKTQKPCHDSEPCHGVDQEWHAFISPHALAVLQLPLRATHPGTLHPPPGGDAHVGQPQAFQQDQLQRARRPLR